MPPGVRSRVLSSMAASSGPNWASMRSPRASSMKLSYVPDSSPGAVIDSGASGRSVVEPSSLGERLGVVPVGDGVRLGAHQRVQVGERQALDRVVGVGDDGDAVVADLELGVLDAVVGADGRFFVVVIAGSSARIAREASAMSPLSTQKKSAKPAPVPSSPTK